MFNKWSGIPYTSMITVFGLILGCTYRDFDKIGLERIGKAIEAYSQMGAHTILLLFLPALIFESAFNSDWHIFKVELP